MKAELMRLKRDTDSGRAAVVSTDAADDHVGTGALARPAERSSAESVAGSGSTAGAARTGVSAQQIPVSRSAPAEFPTDSHPTASRKHFWTLGAIAAGIIVAAVVGVIFYRSRANALTEKDSILLADFVNTTGDSVFDGTLKQALAVELEQSPYLNVTPESRIREALKFMGRSQDERLSTDVTREICLREGIKAMLTGSINGLGSHYVIDLNAVNVQTGDSIAREQAEADSKEAVLKTLDSAASNLRGKLGESVASIQKFAKPLEQATTSSLEALQAFSQGQEAHQKLDDSAAIPHLKRAIELDPNFAMAYATLGVVYFNLTQDALGRLNLQKAFELKDRTSERERLYISAHYYDELQGDVSKTIDTYQQWLTTYPRDDVALDNISLRYAGIGQFDKAVATASESLRLNPKETYAYQNLGQAYMGLNRFDESKAVLDKAEAQGITLSAGKFQRFLLAFVQHDDAGMQRSLDNAGEANAIKTIMLMFKMQSQYFEGKTKAARETLNQNLELTQRLGMKEFAANTVVSGSLFDAEMGSSATARSAIAKALALARDKDTRSVAAQLLAEIGDAAGAEKILDGLSQEFPNDTMIHSVWIPITRATTEMHRSNPAKAIELLESARPYELGDGPNSCGFWPGYVRAQAYLQARDGRNAGTEYQRILDHRGVDAASPLYSLARVGLGRAYALQGDNAKARTAYQNFFAAWKDADPDVPVLKQAKAEYAKLQ
jgi:eukaryotic-like serine/threonine-protein kinase